MDRKRTEIAIEYSESKSWIAGTYYIQNLIIALNQVNDNDKPLINIYTESVEVFNHLKSITNYQYLNYNHYNENNISKFKQLINLIFHYIFYDILHLNFYRDFGGVDLRKTKNLFVYPESKISKFYGKNRQLAWIPDFQDRYLPDLFTNKELRSRIRYQYRLIKWNLPIVFSSQDSESDFHKFYPYANNKTYILNFAVTHPNFKNQNISELKMKFNIDKDYFICANQFWAHKNHLFLFSAYKKYLDRGGNCQLICSGALTDYRNKTYIDKIKDFIYTNHLEKKILILGFIDRVEQLCLMDNCYAIIQPSLFEGWSTTVEDAKRLNKFIFLSNLKVHIEQKPRNVCYFDPHNEQELTERLLTVKPTKIIDDYKSHVYKFSSDFMSIINEFKNKR